MFGSWGTLITSRVMEATVHYLADLVATTIEVIMVVVIIIGSVRAVAAIASRLATRQALGPEVRRIWLHYAAWILLALEFALAADIIRTIVGPNWNEIGQLSVIAAIRIALSYFLGRDIDEIEQDDPGAEPSA